MTFGLAISTYFHKNYNPLRLANFKTSIVSLLKSGFPGVIFLVDDGSEITDHLEYINTVDKASRIIVYKKSKNGGIAKVKNTSIRLLLETGVSIGFLADDDVVYHSSDWYSLYIDNIIKTGISHFSFYAYDKESTVVHNDNPIVKTVGLCGCLFTFTRSMIDDIGYIRVLPNKYGHEHVAFTYKCINKGYAPFFCDVIDAKKHISTDVLTKSIQAEDYTDHKLAENSASAFSTLNIKEPCIE